MWIACTNVSLSMKPIIVSVGGRAVQVAGGGDASASCALPPDFVNDWLGYFPEGVEVEVTQVQTFGGFIRHAGTLRKGSLSKPSRPSGAQRLTRSTQRTLPRTDSSRWRRARTRYRKRSMQ